MCIIWNNTKYSIVFFIVHSSSSCSVLWFAWLTVPRVSCLVKIAWANVRACIWTAGSSDATLRSNVVIAGHLRERFNHASNVAVGKTCVVVVAVVVVEFSVLTVINPWLLAATVWDIEVISMLRMDVKDNETVLKGNVHPDAT